MPDTLVIPTLKRKNLRNLVLSDSQASSSSKPSEDLSTTVLPAQEDDETNFPESCNVIIQFRLGIEPGDLGSEGLVVLRTFSKTVTVFQHVVTNSTMVRKVGGNCIPSVECEYLYLLTICRSFMSKQGARSGRILCGSSALCMIVTRNISWSSIVHSRADLEMWLCAWSI